MEISPACYAVLIPAVPAQWRAASRRPGACRITASTGCSSCWGTGEGDLTVLARRMGYELTLWQDLLSWLDKLSRARYVIIPSSLTIP